MVTSTRVGDERNPCSNESDTSKNIYAILKTTEHEFIQLSKN